MDQSDKNQTVLLQGIWNELKTMNQSFNRRLDATEERLGSRIDELETKMDRRFDGVDRRFDEMDERIDGVEESLGKRIDETNNRVTRLEIKLSTEITALAGTVNETNRLLKGWGARLKTVERKVAHLD